MEHQDITDKEVEVTTNRDDFFFDKGDHVIVPGLRYIDGTEITDTVVHDSILSPEGPLYLLWSPTYYNFYWGWFNENQLED